MTDAPGFRYSNGGSCANSSGNQSPKAQFMELRIQPAGTMSKADDPVFGRPLVCRSVAAMSGADGRAEGQVHRRCCAIYCA